MTRERAKELAPIIAAYGEGKKVQVSNGNGWMYLLEPLFNDDTAVYRIKPEPKRRLMTREEVLGFVTHNPHIVVKMSNEDWRNSHAFNYSNGIDEYEWATITERGEIGEPHKFEVDDD